MVRLYSIPRDALDDDNDSESEESSDETSEDENSESENKGLVSPCINDINH